MPQSFWKEIEIPTNMDTPMVVDTSVIIKWLNKTGEERIQEADALLELALSRGSEFIVPDLIWYEIGNVLLKSKKLTPQAVFEAYKTFTLLPLHIVPQTMRRALAVYEMASLYTMTYYDASFVALAYEVGATLVTDNPKHQKKDHGVKVIALEDY